jgi:transcriptional regulator with XRE-family HTH domain
MNRSAEEWFRELIEQGENDPESLTDELLLDVSEQFYTRMSELGLRPMDLAETLGVSRAYVSQLLNGKPNMTMRTLTRVANALHQQVEIQLHDKSAARTAESTMTVTWNWMGSSLLQDHSVHPLRTPRMRRRRQRKSRSTRLPASAQPQLVIPEEDSNAGAVAA